MSSEHAGHRGTDSPFGRAVPLGRVRRIRIGAHWSVLVIVVLIAQLVATQVLPAADPGRAAGLYWGLGTAAAVLFMTSLVAHEVAHALVARHYGLRVTRITVWMLGGLTEIDGEPSSPRADALTAAAGPGTSLLLGAFAVGLAVPLETAGCPVVLTATVRWLGEVNIALAVFNLIPAAPLDGGRLLRALLWRRLHNRYRAAALATRAGRVTGLLFIALGAVEFLVAPVSGLWLALIGWFVYGGAASELYAVTADRVRTLRVRDVMASHPVTAPAWLTVEDFVEQLRPEHSAQAAFPVLDEQDAVIGVLTWPDLEGVPRERRAHTRLRDLSSRHRPFFTVQSQTPLPEIVLPLHLRGGHAVVVDDGHLVGVVSESDVRAAADRTRQPYA